MKVDLGVREVETDDINFIVVDAVNFPATDVFATGRIVISTTDRREFSWYEGRGKSIGELEDVIGAMHSLIKAKGEDGFVMFRDKFLINISNVDFMKLKTNYSGFHSVEAKFKNGQNIMLYMGQREQYAVDIIRQYQRAQREIKPKYENEQSIAFTRGNIHLI